MNTFDSPPLPGGGLVGISQRLPPQNEQAEQALLGALLANNKAYERVSEFLAPEHFADPIHGRIYQAIQRRIEAGQLADAVTLRAEFQHSGVLDEVGGPAYLATLLSAMVGIINAGEYGKVIHDAFLRRQLIDLGEVVVNRAFGTDSELDAKQQLEAAEQALFDLATQGSVEGGFVPFARALTEAVNLAEHAMSRGEGISGLPSGLRDFDRFVEVSRELSALPLQIDDTPAITISALRTRCRRLKRTRGLDLVVVDYLQLMRPAAGTRPESRVLEISMITQGLKAIAKELSVPVIALSQLSRAVEQREDKRPQLSDLRESGSIEQDADVVMFVYRDEYYIQAQQPKIAAFENDEKFQEAHTRWQEKMESVHNRADLIIAKQRHGPTGSIPLFFEAEFTRFGDLDTHHDQGGYGE